MNQWHGLCCHSFTESSPAYWLLQKRQVEQQLRDMEAKAKAQAAAADVEAKQKAEEIAKRKRELVTLKIRNIGKDALKVPRAVLS